jgi:hypothetical protein
VPCVLKCLQDSAHHGRPRLPKNDRKFWDLTREGSAFDFPFLELLLIKGTEYVFVEKCLSAFVTPRMEHLIAYPSRYENSLYGVYDSWLNLNFPVMRCFMVKPQAALRPGKEEPTNQLMNRILRDKASLISPNPSVAWLNADASIDENSTPSPSTVPTWVINNEEEEVNFEDYGHSDLRG